MKRVLVNVNVALLVLLLGLAAGCDRDEGGAATSRQPATAPAPAQAPSPAISPRRASPSSAAVEPRVVFLGDSLTAGLGLDSEQAFPAVLGETLRNEGLPVRVVNAGVSGDTTAGGLRRMDWLLRQGPDIVVIGLGGNDGLRGLQPAASEANLREIVRKCRTAGADVLLLGMQIPPNYGPEYTASFREIYPRVAREEGVPLVPFLLEGVGGNPRLNQPDGIHPTAEGARVVAGNILPRLRPLVRRRSDRATTRTSPTSRPAGD